MGFIPDSSIATQPGQGRFVPDNTQEQPKNNLHQIFQGQMQGAKDILNWGNTGALKLATGQGFQDRAINATTPIIPPNTSRPFDANVTAASQPMAQMGNIAKMAGAGTMGSIADQVTSPIGLAAPV